MTALVLRQPWQHNDARIEYGQLQVTPSLSKARTAKMVEVIDARLPWSRQASKAGRDSRLQACKVAKTGRAGVGEGRGIKEIGGGVAITIKL